MSIESKYFDVARVKEKVSGEKFVPHVIEPSHGLDRIMYTCLEHAYTEKEDKEGKYLVMRLAPLSAPIKLGIFPLMGKDDLLAVAADIDAKMRAAGLTTYSDDSGSIGRRYARMDEVGTPYCVTVDYQTLEDDTVTIRDRDSTAQVRVKRPVLLKTVVELLNGRKAFADLKG
jgi:glycyl-tRNA synthetase